MKVSIQPLQSILITKNKLNSNLEAPKLYSVIDFLKYLNSQNEMEVYYLLLNEVEIKFFKNNELEIAAEEINRKIVKQLADLLFAWTAQKWNVIITQQSEIVTLKNKLISEAGLKDEWRSISTAFPGAKISDILLA
jgi:DNA polymerase III subunit gamma/tau